MEGHLEEVEGGMKLTPTQTNMPDGEGAYYRDGWKTYYFQTLKKQFAKKRKS